MFGRLFGRKKEEKEDKTPPCISSGIVHNVKMPGESTMYYDHELERWRERGKEHLEEEEKDYGLPPEVGQVIKKEEPTKPADKLDFMMAPPTAYTQRLLEKKKTAPPAFFGSEAERNAEDGEAPAELPPTPPPPSSQDDSQPERREAGTEEDNPPLGPPPGPAPGPPPGPFAAPPAGPAPEGPAASPFGAAAAAGASTNPFGPPTAFGGTTKAPVNPFAPRAVTGAPNPNAPKGFRESARKQVAKKKAQEKKKPSPYAASSYGKNQGNLDDMMDPEGAGDAGEICFVSAAAKERQETPPPPPQAEPEVPTLGETGEEEHLPPPAVPPSPLRTSMPAYSPFQQPQIPRGYGGREEREEVFAAPKVEEPEKKAEEEGDIFKVEEATKPMELKPEEGDIFKVEEAPKPMELKPEEGDIFKLEEASKPEEEKKPEEGDIFQFEEASKPEEKKKPEESEASQQEEASIPEEQKPEVAPEIVQIFAGAASPSDGWNDDFGFSDEEKHTKPEAPKPEEKKPEENEFFEAEEENNSFSPEEASKPEEEQKPEENDSFSPEEASKPEEEQKPEELPKPEEKKQEDTEGTNMKLLDMESRLAQSEAAKNQIQQEEQMKNNALQAKLSEMESKLAQVLQEEQMKNNALQAKLSEMESKLAQVLQEGRPQENNELQTKLSEMESKLSQLEAAKNQALQEEQMKNKELQARLFEMESRFAAGAMGTQDAPAFAPTPAPIEEGAATGVGKAGAIRDLMAHLIKSQHDVATCSKVCRSLEDISFDDVDGQQELISSGAVEVILSLLRAHQECDPLLLKPMMDSFWNLTYDEQAVDRATAHGAVDCVTTIMAKHTSCAELEVGCCGVLLNLAVMDKNRRRIVEIGAGPLVANVVQTHAACEQVVESACQLLYMLAFHADLRPMMAASTTPVAEIASRCSPNSKKWGQWLSEVCEVR